MKAKVTKVDNYEERVHVRVARNYSDEVLYGFPDVVVGETIEVERRTNNPFLVIVT